MLHLLTLLIGFVPLIWGAHLLVNGATAIANNYKVSPMVIGLTIVAFGTSAPELAVNVFASINKDNYITMGNVIGSNIFNVTAILGISAMVYPLAVKPNTTWLEVPLSLLAALVVVISANDVFFDGQATQMISRADGLLMIFFFLIFIVYNITLLKKGNGVDIELKIKNYSNGKSWVFVVLGLITLVAGGQLIVYSARNFAEYLGITERIIALIVVSAGTSLPELTTSIVAAKKKNVDLAVGNIVGSNIFNIFFILGISAIIHPVGIGRSINEDLLFNAFISLLLFVFIFTGKGRMIDRVEGGIFVALYIFYNCYILFMM